MYFYFLFVKNCSVELRICHIFVNFHLKANRLQDVLPTP